MSKILQFPVKEEEVKEIAEVISTQNQVLSDLIKRSHTIQEGCSDYNITKANNLNLRLDDSAGITYIEDSGEIRRSSISSYALSQLGGKIGVPSKYLEKCVNTGRIELAQQNVNSWLESYNKDLFIREYNGGIRGVLSSKYSVCDTPEILQVLDDSLDLGGFKIKGSFLSEERFHLRLVDPIMLPIEGEDLFAGLTVDSSDVGRNILQCNFLIYKQVCTNGLIISKGNATLFQQKHIGISAEEFKRGLTEALDVNLPNLIDETVALIERKRNSGEVLKNLFDENELQNLTDTLRINGHTKEDASKVIEMIQTKKYDNSKWGLINAITEVAQDSTLEKRLELERYAGRILIA